MLRLNCDSTPPLSPLSSRHSSFQGCSWNNGQISKDDHGMLDMAPRASYNLKPEAKLGKIFLDQSSVWSESEMTPCSSSLSSNASNSTNSKSSMELVKEITSLETEILHLERYLLALYRTAFQPHVHGVQIKKFSSEYKIESQLQTVADQSIFKVNSDGWSSGYHGQLSTPREGFAGLNHQISSCISNSSSRKERKTARCSLGEHFGASCANNDVDGPDKLSEDIIRCISLIYCKLGDQNQAQSGPLVSSASSLSSSGTNRTRNLSDAWSPLCSEEPTWDSKHDNLKEERGPNANNNMIEVLKINVDDDGFNYASRMLKKYRTLVKKLESVDPGKMKREQKLAFWINIHNALVMHAYLAYGTHNNTKSNSILKATYSIGGHSINAYIIQISILGIKSHFRAPWLQSLLSPGRKLKMEPNKHIYAIEYPEPLVHFALSLGSFSDPAVRVYNAKTIFQDLRLAKEEFIRSTVYVNKETRIYLPKILYFFAKDMAMSMASLLEIVNACLSESQQKLMKTSIKGKPEKCVYWLSQSCIFRYAIHRDTVEGRLSV